MAQKSKPTQPASPPSRRRQPQTPRFTPRVERLELRDVPAVFNIANGNVVGLIAAITTANTNNQADTINLATGGVYTLTAVNNVTIGNGTNGLPVITSDNGNALTIN